jgi:hypothetical protein
MRRDMDVMNIGKIEVLVLKSRSVISATSLFVLSTQQIIVVGVPILLVRIVSVLKGFKMYIH